MTSDDGGNSSRRPFPLLIAAVVVAAISVAAVYAFVPDGGAGSSATMQDRAASVMPFDLNRTHHTFTKTDDGGIQTVVVLDPTDETNLASIRSHLADEADRFRRGDFADPAKIHGMQMPGLAVLRTRAREIQVAYAETRLGATLTYVATDPKLVATIHAWFDAQTMDHSQHDMGG